MPTVSRSTRLESTSIEAVRSPSSGSDAVTPLKKSTSVPTSTVWSKTPVIVGGELVSTSPEHAMRKSKPRKAKLNLKILLFFIHILYF